MWAPKFEARVLQELQARRAASRCSRSAPAAATSPRCSRAAPADVTRSRSTAALSASAAAQARAARASPTSRCDVGDGARGWGNEHYDAIVLTGSTPLLPGDFFRAVEARRPRVRDRRRRAGDDGAARRAGRRRARASRPICSRPWSRRSRTPPRRRGSSFDSRRSPRPTRRVARRRGASGAGRRRRARALGIRALPHRGLAARSACASCRRACAELPRDRELVLVCHHGSRSQHAAHVARAERLRRRAQPARRRRGMGARGRSGDAALLNDVR